METPDHIEFDVRPVDIGVLKDLAVGTLRAVREVFRMPREFASHGDHTFGKRPFETPIEQPAQDWANRVIPDVAGRDLLPNVQLGEE